MVLSANKEIEFVEIENFNPKTLNNKYLLFLPKGYVKTNKDLPFLFFLHGAGERGNEIEIVKRNGPPKFISQNKNFPFIMAAPQCKEEMRWNTDELIKLLDEIILKYKIDTKRIYLTGLSMGGFGTWEIAVKYPEKFAAIIPVCGGGDPAKACIMKNLPIWAFHGAKDDIVPLSKSEEMIKALKKCGGNPLFTIYPNAEHDSWTETYNNPEIYKWLSQFHK
jgi:predicted peptidase